ncbi:hypothetical protein HDA36_001716 [Nocardiopsis composta]|uniref:Uncharacterized protein n=1 Tax=Nocardiopsis composta TaxID=157465 RepID=A0A7W8QJJ8_9ACTN|nr:hypothetical protein [Nocardiopsis composta]
MRGRRGRAGLRPDRPPSGGSGAAPGRRRCRGLTAERRGRGRRGGRRRRDPSRRAGAAPTRWWRRTGARRAPNRGRTPRIGRGTRRTTTSAPTRSDRGGGPGPRAGPIQRAPRGAHAPRNGVSAPGDGRRFRPPALLEGAAPAGPSARRPPRRGGRSSGPAGRAIAPPRVPTGRRCNRRSDHRGLGQHLAAADRPLVAGLRFPVSPRSACGDTGSSGTPPRFRREAGRDRCRLTRLRPPPCRGRPHARRPLRRMRGPLSSTGRFPQTVLHRARARSAAGRRRSLTSTAWTHFPPSPSSPPSSCSSFRRSPPPPVAGAPGPPRPEPPLRAGAGT